MLEGLTATQQVATYLIIYRVADGTAWTKKMLDSATLTTINFKTGHNEIKTVDLTGVESSRTEINVVDLASESGQLQEKEGDKKV